MKKLLGIISLFTLTTTQILAGTHFFSDLSKTEQKKLIERYDNALIQYDESTNEMLVDEALERELRLSGFLKMEDIKKGVLCTGV